MDDAGDNGLAQEHDILTLLPAELFWRILDRLPLDSVAALLATSTTIREKCEAWPLHHLNLTPFRKRAITSALVVPMVHRWGRTLRHVTLTQCDVDDSVFLVLSLSAPSLERLYAGKTNVTDAGIKAIANACPNLRVLSVPFTAISSDALLCVAKCCPGLELLSLRECRGVKAAGVTAVAAKCKNLETVFLDGYVYLCMCMCMCMCCLLCSPLSPWRLLPRPKKAEPPLSFARVSPVR